mgnify:CR=1 FL=1
MLRVWAVLQEIKARAEERCCYMGSFSCDKVYFFMLANTISQK